MSKETTGDENILTDDEWERGWKEYMALHSMRSVALTYNDGSEVLVEVGDRGQIESYARIVYRAIGNEIAK